MIGLKDFLIMNANIGDLLYNHELYPILLEVPSFKIERYEY